MPAKSKAQLRYMYAAAEEKVKSPGLSKEEAKDFTKGMTKQKFSKLRDYVKKNK